MLVAIRVQWLSFSPKRLGDTQLLSSCCLGGPARKMHRQPGEGRGTCCGRTRISLLPGEAIVEENGRPTSGAFAEQPSANVFCLNHYLIKSHQELIERRSRPKIDGAMSVHSIEKWKSFDSTYNSVEDLRIQRFAAALERKTWLQNLTARFGAA